MGLPCLVISFVLLHDVQRIYYVRSICPRFSSLSPNRDEWLHMNGFIAPSSPLLGIALVCIQAPCWIRQVCASVPTPCVGWGECLESRNPEAHVDSTAIPKTYRTSKQKFWRVPVCDCLGSMCTLCLRTKVCSCRAHVVKPKNTITTLKSCAIF